ncbi:MAG: allophanate hydrolase subunit 2 [Psychromonas sp.]|jgi:hypothetical protein
MSKLKVIQPGMLSLIQDVGRFGVAQLGLSQEVSVGDAVRFKQVSQQEFTRQGGQICPN